jgi:hypothetical protein
MREEGASNRSRNSASVIPGFTVTASKPIGEDALRSAVSALASFFEATVPADRAGCADTQVLGGLSTAQATINHGQGAPSEAAVAKAGSGLSIEPTGAARFPGAIPLPFIIWCLRRDDAIRG